MPGSEPPPVAADALFDDLVCPSFMQLVHEPGSTRKECIWKDEVSIPPNTPFGPVLLYLWSGSLGYWVESPSFVSAHAVVLISVVGHVELPLTRSVSRAWLRTRRARPPSRLKSSLSGACSARFSWITWSYRLFVAWSRCGAKRCALCSTATVELVAAFSLLPVCRAGEPRRNGITHDGLCGDAATHCTALVPAAVQGP